MDSGSIHKSVHGDDGRDLLERILTTCEAMLRDRGCVEVGRADDPAGVVASGGMTPVLVGRGEAGLAYDVFVHAEDKVGVKYARTVLETREGEDDNVHCLIVSPQGPTPFTRRECDGKPVQFFLAKELCVNVTKHALVPKHERVALSDVHPPVASPAQLPRLFLSDPIVRYHDWGVGTVVRVWRRFGGHEPVPYFRVVSAGSS